MAGYLAENMAMALVIMLENHWGVQWSKANKDWFVTGDDGLPVSIGFYSRFSGPDPITALLVAEKYRAKQVSPLPD